MGRSHGVNGLGRPPTSETHSRARAEERHRSSRERKTNRMLHGGGRLVKTGEFLSRSFAARSPLIAAVPHANIIIDA